MIRKQILCWVAGAITYGVTVVAAAWTVAKCMDYFSNPPSTVELRNKDGSKIVFAMKDVLIMEVAKDQSTIKYYFAGSDHIVETIYQEEREKLIPMLIDHFKSTKIRYP